MINKVGLRRLLRKILKMLKKTFFDTDLDTSAGRCVFKKVLRFARRYACTVASLGYLNQSTITVVNKSLCFNDCYVCLVDNP